MIKTLSSREIYQRISKLLSVAGEGWTEPETGKEYCIFEHELPKSDEGFPEGSVCFAMKLTDGSITVYTPNEMVYLSFESDGSIRKPSAEPTLGVIDEWLDDIEQHSALPN